MFWTFGAVSVSRPRRGGSKAGGSARNLNKRTGRTSGHLHSRPTGGDFLNEQKTSLSLPSVTRDARCFLQEFDRVKKETEKITASSGDALRQLEHQIKVVRRALRIAVILHENTGVWTSTARQQVCIRGYMWMWPYGDSNFFHFEWSYWFGLYKYDVRAWLSLVTSLRAVPLSTSLTFDISFSLTYVFCE